MVQLKATSQKLLKDQNDKQQKEFEAQLEKSLNNLREEYCRKLEENKEEQARLYKMKEADHISTEEALRSDLKSKIADLESAQKKIKELTEAVRKLEGERHALLVKLDDLEKEKEAERIKMTSEIKEKEKEIEVRITEKNGLLSHCQHLLDVKVALDNELATYKTLLETEESRLEMGDFMKKDENQNFLAKQQTVEI